MQSRNDRIQRKATGSVPLSSSSFCTRLALFDKSYVVVVTAITRFCAHLAPHLQNISVGISVSVRVVSLALERFSLFPRDRCRCDIGIWVDFHPNVQKKRIGKLQFFHNLVKTCKSSIERITLY